MPSIDLLYRRPGRCQHTPCGPAMATTANGREPASAKASAWQATTRTRTRLRVPGFGGTRRRARRGRSAVAAPRAPPPPGSQLAVVSSPLSPFPSLGRWPRGAMIEKLQGGRCLPIPRSAVESSKRPAAVVGRSLVGKPRLTWRAVWHGTSVLTEQRDIPAMPNPVQSTVRPRRTDR